MEYTIKKLAQLSGVTVRTLRYYDQIGLLKPARINSSGYRIYGEAEVDRLQHILFYRELEVPLESIQVILDDPSFDKTTALQSHYTKLQQKRDRLDTILATIEKTIAYQERGIPMQDNEKFNGMKEKMIEENERTYGADIREKYGDEIINASKAKLRGLSQEKYEAMQALEHNLLSLLQKAYTTGDPSSEDAQELAARHKEWLLYSWPSYSKKAHAGLAEMYVADERFTAYYDQHVKGGTAFLRDAILIYTGVSSD